MENKSTINIPSDYQKINSLPEDPENSTSYAKQTQSSNIFLMVYPTSNQQVIPYKNERSVIDSIHDTLAEDQGLVEVQSGVTASQKDYIYSIIKTKLKPSGMQYATMMYINMGGYSIAIHAYSDEAGITGSRDATILNKLIGEKVVTMPSMDGWFKDPYDDDYKKGLLRNESEKPEYDSAFPQHPLSEARSLIKYIVENN